MATSIDPAMSRAETPPPVIARQSTGEPGTEAEKLRDELDCLRAQVANLQIALDSSRRIGVAMGIVMANRKVDIDEAFAFLRTVSQRRHQKLRDVADELVYTGDVDNV